MLASDELAPARVVSTHHLDDIVAVADRVVVITDGSIAFDGPVGQLEAIADGAGDRMRAIQAALAALGGSPHLRSTGA